MKKILIATIATALMCGSAFAQGTAAGDSSKSGGQPTKNSGSPSAAEQGAGSESKAMAPGNGGMAKDGMSKDGMTKKGMKSDSMSKDGMKK